MKNICLAIFSLCFFYFGHTTDKKEITSPDGKIKVIVEVNENLFYSVTYQNKIVVLPSIISMVLENGLDISGKIDLKKTTFRFNSSVIVSPVPEKENIYPTSIMSFLFGSNNLSVCCSGFTMME